MPQRAKPGGFGTIVVAAGVIGTSWLAVRQLTKSISEHAPVADAAPTAFGTGVDPSKPLVPTIPSAIVEDAGKKAIARIDLVLRMDGVDVSAEGAPACRDGNHTRVGRASGGAAGTFDASMLTACITSVLAGIGERVPVATITRAGPAVPSEYVDALAAETKRAGVVQVLVQP